MDYNAETPDYCYGCKSLAFQLAQKDIDIERIQERCERLDKALRLIAINMDCYQCRCNLGTVEQALTETKGGE